MQIPSSAPLAERYNEVPDDFLLKPGDGPANEGMATAVVLRENTHDVSRLLSDKAVNERAEAISIYHDQAKVVSLNDTDPGGNALCHIGGTSFRPGNAVLIPTPVFHGIARKGIKPDTTANESGYEDTGAVRANSRTTA